MAEAKPPLRSPRSNAELFRVFTRLALQGFGGVLPIAQRELVEREQWLSSAQFLELLSVSQVLPGPNVINLALIFGDRHLGLRGALAAVAGLLAAPLALLLVLALAVQQVADLPMVAAALRGMGAVAAALVAGTAWKLAGTLRSNAMGRIASALLVAATVVGVAVLHWPLAAVVLGLGVPAMAWAAWCLRRGEGARSP